MGMKECSLRNTDHGRSERNVKIGIPAQRSSLTLGESKPLQIDSEWNDMPYSNPQIGFRIAEKHRPKMTPSSCPKSIHQDWLAGTLG